MITNQLVENATVKAQGAQSIVRQTESTDVSFENDLLKSTGSSQRTLIDVKVIMDGKIGTSSTTDIHDLDGVVARALESAEFGSTAHFEFPRPQDGKDVRVYDEDVVPLMKPEMIQVGQEMMDRIKEYDPDILVSASVNRRITKTDFANSSGTSFDTESTDLGVQIFAQRIRGTDILNVWHSLSGKKRDIDHITVAQKVVHWFRMAESTAAVQSGYMPVVFTPKGMAVLVVTLCLGLDGKNVLLGSSPLGNKLGEQVVDKRFSFIDNPLIDYAPGSKKYDDEGIPHRITPLIENGIVRNFLYDLDTAGQAGVETTGHGDSRNPTNLLIGVGDVPNEEMVKDIQEGLLVHDVLGLGQGNPISGEFSVNVALGFKIENGEIVGRVKDVMISGNAFDALNDIISIGDTAEWVRGLPINGFFPQVQVGSVSVVTR